MYRQSQGLESAVPSDDQVILVFVLLRMLMLFLMVGLGVALVAALLPLFRNYLGGDDRRIRDARTLPPHPDQLERLEERLEQLAQDQQHLAEQQQFITKLLEERASSQRPPET